MILVDVTKSLENSEVQQVSKLAADVLDKFPDNTDYVIYPIQWETERPSAIDEAHPNIGQESRLTEDDKKDRRELIKKKIGDAYLEVNRRQPIDRTCILNTLELADKHFNQAANRFSVDKSPCMELVIVSDMIEQCGINSLNTRIDLKERPISEALDLANRFTTLPNLSRLHITVIVPTAEDSTPYARNRPRLGDLERFWDTIFERCGFKATDLKTFNWLPTVPGRFEHVCE